MNGESEGRKILKIAVEVVLCFFIAILLVGVVQQFFLAPVGVLGTSMAPTINKNFDWDNQASTMDKVFVQKRFYSISRGDVIVFYRPMVDEPKAENPANTITISDFFNSLPFVNKTPTSDESKGNGEYMCLIKRVIGVPGDKVEIRHLASGFSQLLVNDKVVNDGFAMNTFSVREGIWNVGEDEFFVLGDNRNHSNDSEDFGCIKQNWLMGKVVMARIDGKYTFGLGMTII